MGLGSPQHTPASTPKSGTKNLASSLVYASGFVYGRKAAASDVRKLFNSHAQTDTSERIRNVPSADLFDLLRAAYERVSVDLYLDE